MRLSWGYVIYQITHVACFDPPAPVTLSLLVFLRTTVKLSVLEELRARRNGGNGSGSGGGAAAAASAHSTEVGLTFLPLVESHADGEGPSSLEYASDLEGLSYVTCAAAMPAGWCMVADAPCDPNWIRIISPDGVVLTCGHGAATFADGEAQDAAFNEPHGIAPLPGGHACVVGDRSNGCIRHVTRAGVVSTIAGRGDCGFPFNEPPLYDAGELAAASFGDPALVAVDVHGRVLVVDWEAVGRQDGAEYDSRNTTRFRKIYQSESSNQFTTLCDEEGVALHNIDCQSCAIDERGSIWCGGTAGIVIIDNTGRGVPRVVFRTMVTHRTQL